MKHCISKMLDFLGGPLVKTSSSNVKGEGSIPGQGTEIPHGMWPKKQNPNTRSIISTNSIKTVKLVHIKKNILKKDCKMLKHPFLHFKKFSYLIAL